MSAVMRRANIADAPVFAALHETSFGEPWTAESFAVLLAQPGVAGWLWGEPPAGLLLVRAAADEAEILTLAVAPAARRRHGAHVMIAEALRVLAQGLTRRIFLEVAADNTAALAVYSRAGFIPCGRRPGYYAKGSIDAVIMERTL
ncbi:MAG: GNAT family N-acetyltransferase [Rhodospirillaceae bacterium]